VCGFRKGNLYNCSAVLNITASVSEDDVTVLHEKLKRLFSAFHRNKCIELNEAAFHHLLPFYSVSVTLQMWHGTKCSSL
jgi:hypothetical protein